MMKARLFYDGNCPVCTGYVRMLRKKVDINKIDFIPSNTDNSDFQYVDMNGNMSKGNIAISALARDFPDVLNYFWMLPPKYKVSGLKAAYKIGNALRKVIKPKSGCNCGKK